MSKFEIALATSFKDVIGIFIENNNLQRLDMLWTTFLVGLLGPIWVWSINKIAQEEIESKVLEGL